ncbi:phage holin family protein [Micromonospora sp. AMSO1212t]|uniref:phage holin family protein n=1 Tax=Micromonospora sp. AMSO1212t TaxID=2650565 RepID=UPI00124AF283|nr:phage holin family protein [Micromonospora sp. AMSO1212t]KAB1909266.1 phage holin family protein [Micromonospora sp. AMSO1212t]
MSTPSDADRPERAQSSVGELLADATRNFSLLLRQEIDLAKAEVREEVRTIGTVAAMFAAAGIAALITLLFLSHALWWGLSNVMDQGWAALIVAVIWAVIGAVLASRARGQMRSIRTLSRTKQTAREIPDAARGR